MSPSAIVRKTQNGGIEIIPLKAAQSVAICVKFNGLLFEDAYFEDRQSQQEFYVVGFEGIAPVNFGLYNGEAWYRWIWCWESTTEADQALKQIPDGIDNILEQLVLKVNDFIREAREENARTGNTIFVLDVTKDMKSIGWELTILPFSKQNTATDYEIYKRLKAQA